ncbi:MAG: arginine--tRNA ligase [bacterium]|nr:arginine--tRNA ligase [bacterium]
MIRKKMMTTENIKNLILSRVEEAALKLFGQKPKIFDLTYPPDVNLGDFTIECFSFAKEFKKSPEEIAKNLAEAIKLDKVIKEIQAVGPYLNFKVDKALLFKEVLEEIFKKEKPRSIPLKRELRGRQIMVEYLSPNTNKPLHLGHIRNGVLGMAISRLMESIGYKVIKANLINDRGIHICQSMLAWQKWGNGETPELAGIKGDYFVGQWYVKYHQEANKSLEAKEQLEKEAQEMLQKWEAVDSETIKLWKMMNEWVYRGFEKTYKELGLEFDVFNHESETYKSGKEIVETGLLKKGIFKKTDDGAIIAELENEQKITLLRADGTSVYITQDLGTAKLRFDNYHLDKLIYVVGVEQDFHFKNLFKILKMLGFKWVDKLRHLSYGMVNLPEGKMKSREGKVIDADDLIGGMKELAAEEIRKRHPELAPEEIIKRAKKIGVGAIKFYLLRVKPNQEINFNPEESISFDGFTGPYVQYAFARASGIIKKIQENNLRTYDVLRLENVDFSVLKDEKEMILLRCLIQFPEKIKSAVDEFNPSVVAEHIFEIAKAFNNFYVFCPVLAAENEKLIKARLALVRAVAIVLKKGLNLLGIEDLEEM